jgi:hypothetical protein
MKTYSKNGEVVHIAEQPGEQFEVVFSPCGLSFTEDDRINVQFVSLTQGQPRWCKKCMELSDGAR